MKALKADSSADTSRASMRSVSRGLRRGLQTPSDCMNFVYIKQRVQGTEREEGGVDLKFLICASNKKIPLELSQFL